jgi:hypothetical protein
MLLQTFANVAAGQNLAARGIIPTITFHDFDKLVRAEPMVVDPSHEICGATPAGHIPEITSPDWPVEIHDYMDRVEPPIVVDSDTNKSRYGGMKKALGIALDDTDYQASFTGSKDETANIPSIDNAPAEIVIPNENKIGLVKDFYNANPCKETSTFSHYEPSNTGCGSCEVCDDCCSK